MKDFDDMITLARHRDDKSSKSEKLLQGYRLATAEILYHMPDHPAVLQSYIWQDLDLAPRFPILRKFLNFWQQNLDGPLHSVRLGHSQLISAGDLALTDGEFQLH